MKFPILLPNIFNHPFTYESDLKLQVGDFVEVPFGKSKITGVVWDEFEKKNNKSFKTKQIIKKFQVPKLKKNTLKFLNWFAEYNVVPKGMALKLILLSGKTVNRFDDKFYKPFCSKIKSHIIKLTKEQQLSLNEINIYNQTIKVQVLHATTGSVKTIVHMYAFHVR